MKTIHCACVTHSSGNSFYAAHTVEALKKKVADYCRFWWAEEFGEEDKIPDTDEEVWTEYFDRVVDEEVEFGEAEVED